MISFRTLGTVELHGQDGRELLSVLSQPKRLALLTYLVVAEPRGLHRRDKLLALLWPQLDQERARAALRKSLHHLRRSLGSQALLGRGDEEVGIADDTIRCDTVDFQKALDAGRTADALDLYAGPFMDGFFLTGEPDFERWLDEFRATMARRAHEAVWTLVEQSEDEGNTAGALSWAERGHALSPFDELGARRLIELKVRLGDRSGAVRSFGKFAERLREELELEPSAELAALVKDLASERSPGGESASPETAPKGYTAGPAPSRTHPRPTTPPDSPEAAAVAAEGVRPLGAAGGEALAAHGLEFLRMLGDGSVSRVYLARETDLQRLVVVKVLDPDLALEPVARQRFERAARAAARVRHRNVVAIHRVSTLEDGTPFMVMEYIEGRSLADALKADGLPDSVTARDILRDIAAALAASHENRVVHRDLRPANVLREDRTGRIVLTDFGLARILDTGSEEFAHLTRPGQMLGDPSHISPEQIRGEPVTHETDMYSFGVLGYHVLAGRGPFLAEGTAELLQAHSESVPDDVMELRPDADPELADLLERCLAKRPEHRPRAADVVRILAEPPDAMASPAVVRRPSPGEPRPQVATGDPAGAEGDVTAGADPKATADEVGPRRTWTSHGWLRGAAVASILTLVALVIWWMSAR